MDRRELLLGATFASSATGRARAAPLEGSAVRASDRTMRLTWNTKAPVSIYVATDPDTPRAEMRRLGSALRGGEVVVAGPISPRPYYLLASPDGAQTRVAERLLPLKGGRNFRDLGGYRAADGRQVRWGRIYRSGAMSGLIAEYLDYLNHLNLRVVCDLRSLDERRGAPSPFVHSGGVELLSADYRITRTAEKLGQPKTRAEAIDAFAATYLNFIDLLEPQYRAMFNRLLAGEMPLAMHCSAGKDRTGMASALILSVLGVPRETVIADFALTQVYSPSRMTSAQLTDPGRAMRLGVSPELSRMFASMPDDVVDVFMGSDPAIMRKVLAGIDAKYGGPIQLAKARFGLSDAGIASMRHEHLV